MAVPGELEHINLWVLAGTNASLVDAGLGDEPTRAAWRALLDGPLSSQRIERLILTHHHPDHAGSAGWLAQRLDCAIHMTAPEFASCIRHIDDAAHPPDAAMAFLRRAGWDAGHLAAYPPFHGRFGHALGSFPTGFVPIVDCQEIVAGGRTWRTIVTAGHAPAHACLFDPDARILIAGDQILPSITAVVPVPVHDPAADPLADWFQSLDRLAALLPDDTLVLPAHGVPFAGPHARIAAIVAHHQAKLASVRAMLAEPCTTAAIVERLFRRAVDGRTIILRTGAALAYANHLVARGDARSEEADGVLRYALRQPAID